MDDDGRPATDAEAWVYYKLTLEPEGSGELIMAGVKSGATP